MYIYIYIYVYTYIHTYIHIIDIIIDIIIIPPAPSAPAPRASPVRRRYVFKTKKLNNNCLHFSICACHPCAGAMLIFAFTVSPPTKSLGFRGFDSSKLLIIRGGNAHVRGIL